MIQSCSNRKQIIYTKRPILGWVFFFLLPAFCANKPQLKEQECQVLSCILLTGEIISVVFRVHLAPHWNILYLVSRFAPPHQKYLIIYNQVKSYIS